MESSFAPSIAAEFLELAAIPSPRGQERGAAEWVTGRLQRLGLAVHEDDSGRATGSDSGNLYCRLEPTAVGVPLFFCAHLDTVPLTGPLLPVIDDGIVRNAGGTILGADNKASIVAMVCAVERVTAESRPHAGIELVFTTLEEVGLRGAYAFDHTRLRARAGYVYDQAAPIGEIILGAPHAQRVEIAFNGRAAHAGMAPEDGQSAIVAAAHALTRFRLGRVTPRTTANVGVIAGGSALNVVPDTCTIRAQARSHDEPELCALVAEMLATATREAAVKGCSTESSVEAMYRGYALHDEDEVVQLAVTALEACGHEPRFSLSGGAADANVFNERGIPCVNLANGMTDIHTPSERIAVADLGAMQEVTLALIDAARHPIHALNHGGLG